MNQPFWNVQPNALTAAKNVGGIRLISPGDTIAVLENIEVNDPTATLCLVRYDVRNDSEDPLDQNVDAPLLAKLEFGGGQAASNTVYFDWLNGTIVTVPASGFTISCVYPLRVGGPQAPLRMSVGAIVSGNIPRAGGFGQLPMARFTQRIGALNTGADVLALVPARAHGVRLLTDAPDRYGSYLVGFVNAANKARNPEFSQVPTGPDEMPLASGTRGIVIVSSAGIPTNITLQWSIAL